MLQRAVALDPEYARAWAELAAAARVAPSWTYLDRDYVSISKRAADKALELDQNQSMAWAVRSYVRFKDPETRDFEERQALIETAIEKDPTNTTAILWRGLAWAELGYFDKALADFEHCLQVDPGYSNCNWHWSYVRAIQGDYKSYIEAQTGLYRSGLRGILIFMVPILINQGNKLAAYLIAGEVSDHPDFPFSE